jgi:hypothetical protein
MYYKIKKNPLVLLFFWFVLIQANCINNGEKDFDRMDTLIPIYQDASIIDIVTVGSTQRLVNTSKIYYKDSTIYIIEKEKGIHVVNNKNPSRPVPFRFISIQGCTDISIKNNIMYANSYGDIVLIDIENPSIPIYKKRMKAIFEVVTKDGKPAIGFRRGILKYQCIDSTSNKIVVGWKTGPLDNSKCSKFI